MATRDDFVTIADGDQLNDGYFNGIGNKMIDANTVYTGVAFDSSQSGTGTTTNNHVLSISGGTIYDFVVIAVTFNASAAVNQTGGGGGGSASCSIKFETQENPAGGYTTRLNKTIVSAAGNGGQTTRDTNSCMSTVYFYYVPTAGEISNGLDVRIETSSTANLSGAASASSSVTNAQTILYTS